MYMFDIREFLVRDCAIERRNLCRRPGRDPDGDGLLSVSVSAMVA